MTAATASTMSAPLLVQCHRSGHLQDLGEIYGWDWGFGVAGLGMLAALVIYQFGCCWCLPIGSIDRLVR